MTQREAVAKFLEQVKAAYIADQRQKDIRASGKSAGSFRVEATDRNGKLFGAGYIEFQKVGRRPGKFPPINAILNWIREKRIVSDIPDKSLAFLIARKIAKKGTDIFQGKRRGLSIADKMNSLREQLVQNILQAKRDALLNQITPAKQEMV